MTTPTVFARHKHCVTKELAIGFLTNRNSEIGLIRQVQNISGATGFVCDSLIRPSRYYAAYHANFCWFKAGCGKTVLAYVNRWSLKVSYWIYVLNKVLGDMSLIICKRPFQLETIQSLSTISLTPLIRSHYVRLRS